MERPGMVQVFKLGEYKLKNYLTGITNMVSTTYVFPCFCKYSFIKCYYNLFRSEFYSWRIA